MKLLASARNIEEARIALKAGADIVDLKESSRGSLGAVDYSVASAAGKQLGEWSTLSIAMGELCECDHLSLLDLKLLKHFSFAKIGLAGCRSVRHWQILWKDWAERISRSTAPVAVAYADDEESFAPTIQEVVEIAIQSGTKYFLIDTYCKDGRNLFQHCAVNELSELLRPLRTHAISIALAGSLSADNFEQIVAIEPDIVAVRGAICEDGDREKPICPGKIAELKTLLKAPLMPENAKI